MRGERKPKTILKLDRRNLLPFYLTHEQKALYDADEYKYLVHLLKVTSDDNLCILQYLLLKFHPLILKTCFIFIKRIPIDWIDLISFAKNSFIELIYQFDLDSSLYFRKYMSMALPRAINDYCVYEIRRGKLHSAIRLDELQISEQEALIKDQALLEGESEELKGQKREIVQFLAETEKLDAFQKKVICAFLISKDYLEVGKQFEKSQTQIRKIVMDGLKILKRHFFTPD